MRTPVTGAIPAGGGVTAADDLTAAFHHGRICALAAEVQKDLQACGDNYIALFPEKPFDPRLFSTVALANAFGSPWETPDRVRVAARSSLWVFAADWAVDHLARTPADLADLTRHCTTAIAGESRRPRHREAGPQARGEQTRQSSGAASVHVELARFLADLRSDLAASPIFPEIEALWQDEVSRYLAAVTREWEWNAATGHGEAMGGVAGASGGTPAGRPPSPSEYLDNADTFGSALVNLSHWISTGDGGTLRNIDRLQAISRRVQQVLRLVNDLASYRRDIEWGDLNILMLGTGRAEVAQQITVLVNECLEMTRPLAKDLPVEAAYLERQIGYSTGFYGLADYWGAL